MSKHYITRRQFHKMIILDLLSIVNKIKKDREFYLER
jgi:hypothetical protein